jgi:uncharacterized protein
MYCEALRFSESWSSTFNSWVSAVPRELAENGHLDLQTGSATFIIASIFAGKFYLLFSFLFGYSSNYIIRGERSNRGRWVKRCFVLMGLGVLHFTFLWHGDIIFVYGLFGLLLTVFFFRTDRTLKIWTRIVFIFSSTLILLVGALAFLAERLFPEESMQAPLETKLDAVLLDGSFVDAIPARLELWVYGVSTGVFLQGGMAFAAFLVGVRMAEPTSFLHQLIPSTTTS